MKKLFLACMVAFMSLTASAQFYVGGTLGADYNKVKVEGESESSTAFTIAPEIGYQFNDVIAVGTTLGYGYADEEDFDLSIYQIAPYIRATFAQVKSVKFFAEGALSMAHNKLSGGDDYSYNSYGVALRPGFTVDLGDKVKLLGRADMISYRKDHLGEDLDVKNWHVGIPNHFEIGVLINL